MRQITGYYRFLALGVALAGLGIAAPGVAQESLSLPTSEPDLGVSDQRTLGTNEQDIGLSEGETVPGFSAQSVEGEPVAWAGLVDRAPLLVIFYRGGWCPFCNVQIRQLTEAYSQFESRGVLPVLISADEVDGASLAQRTYDIPFPVLSDPDLSAHEAFGVTMQVDDATVERYKEYNIDLEAWSGRDHHKIAVASAFFVGGDGVVRWAHSSLDYKTRPSPQQLLDVADRIDW